jgi:hypothetical protein
LKSHFQDVLLNYVILFLELFENIYKKEMTF